MFLFYNFIFVVFLTSEHVNMPICLTSSILKTFTADIQRGMSFLISCGFIQQLNECKIEFYEKFNLKSVHTPRLLYISIMILSMIFI